MKFETKTMDRNQLKKRLQGSLMLDRLVDVVTEYDSERNERVRRVYFYNVNGNFSTHYTTSNEEINQCEVYEAYIIQNDTMTCVCYVGDENEND